MTDHSKHKTVIVIAGPTAVGKTAVAIEVAKHFNTAIISADSRQCYKEMNIGVARPSPAELHAVPHYFVASHSIHEEVNARIFEAYALKVLKQLFLQHDVVVMVGGTGLYIKAFCEGLDDIPDVSPAIRQQIIDQYNEYGIEWLQKEVAAKDPLFYEQGETQNPQRLMRALEVMEATGQTILSFHKGNKQKREFDIIKIALALPKEELHHNIHTRVDKMLAAGLIDEVKSLEPWRQLNALQTVGYTEIFLYLDKIIDLETGVEKIKTNTRQYAKRQMTWFKKNKDYACFHPQQVKEIIEYAAAAL